MLLGLGGTPFSQAAVDCAVDLAQRHGASITAAPVLDLNSWKQMFRGFSSAQQAARALEDQPWRHAQQRLEEIVDAFKARCEASGIGNHILAPQDDPLAGLIERWRYHDLLVLGLRGLFDYWVVPDAGAAIARLAQAGVRPIMAPAAEYPVVSRVLVVYDGSMASARALKRFAKINPWPDAAITLSVSAGDDDAAEALLTDALAYCHDHGLLPEAQSHSHNSAVGLLKLANQCRAEAMVVGDDFRPSPVRGRSSQGMAELIRRSDRLLLISH